MMSQGRPKMSRPPVKPWRVYLTDQPGQRVLQSIPLIGYYRTRERALASLIRNFEKRGEYWKKQGRLPCIQEWIGPGEWATRATAP